MTHLKIRIRQSGKLWSSKCVRWESERSSFGLLTICPVLNLLYMLVRMTPGLSPTLPSTGPDHSILPGVNCHGNRLLVQCSLWWHSNSSETQLMQSSRMLKAKFVTVGIRVLANCQSDWRRCLCPPPNCTPATPLFVPDPLLHGKKTQSVGVLAYWLIHVPDTLSHGAHLGDVFWPNPFLHLLPFISYSFSTLNQWKHFKRRMLHTHWALVIMWEMSKFESCYVLTLSLKHNY